MDDCTGELDDGQGELKRPGPSPDSAEGPPALPPDEHGPGLSPEAAADSPAAEPEAGAHAPRKKASADPWAHRRGEPRVFALLWTVYLFIVTAFIFYTALAGPAISPEIMRPAARLVLLLTMGGMALLWPMVRLSQTPDPQPLNGVGQDLLVVMIPAQALVWPQVLWWLARWPLTTVAAVAAAMAAWGLLIGGLLALAHVRGSGRPEASQWPLRNLLWMLVFVAISGCGMVVSLLSGRSAFPGPGDVNPISTDVALMLSPLGAVLELTRDTSWSGRSTPLTPTHWALIGLVAAAAAGLWASAWRFRGARGRTERVGLRFPT
jgi:hypothetical protein